MKVYVINLKRRLDRKEKIKSQFENFSFTNYEFIEAVDGSSQSEEFIESVYDKNTSKNIVRELTRSEIGCALSHIKAYDLILKSKEQGALIIEDDITITKDLINYANQPVFNTDIDCLLLSYHSSNITKKKDQSYKYEIMDILDDKKQSRIYFKKKFVTYNNYTYFEFDQQSLRVDFIFGTYCYYISKSGCNKFKKYNTPVKVSADMIWNLFDVNAYGLRPVLINPFVTDVDQFVNRIDSDVDRDRKEQLKAKNRKLDLCSDSYKKRIKNKLCGT